MKEINDDIRKQIEKLLKEKNRTKKELADYLGVYPSSNLNRKLNDRIPIKELLKIAEFLNEPIGSFFESSTEIINQNGRHNFVGNKNIGGHNVTIHGGYEKIINDDEIEITRLTKSEENYRQTNSHLVNEIKRLEDIICSKDEIIESLRSTIEAKEEIIELLKSK